MELINTIEISPYDYANSDYKYPVGNSKDYPEEWEKFWHRCLADKNLENLKAIKTGSYLVDITSIQNEELEVIVKNELKDIELEDYKDQVGSLCGGIVLKINQEFLIEPTCCGDIGNIWEWEKMLKEKAESWRQLWIGHPWIFYRKVKEKIEFSDYYEANIEDLINVQPILEIQVEELKSKLKTVKNQQIEFENKISVILKNLRIKNSKQIAKLLAGNE